jgi:hypothetical protein
MQSWVLAAAGMLAACFSAPAQPVSDPCRVEGTVLNAVTGQPVRKARITLTPMQGGEPMLASTDSQGKYALPNIPPGTYNLAAAHDGYIGQRYGAQKPGEGQKGESFELKAGSVKSGIDLKLTPLGSIMGFVRDEDGDPIRQMNVAVLAYGYSPSGRELQIRSETQTDALGEYRLFDLPPGTYYLRAKPMSARASGIAQATETYATIYYPNSIPQSGASAIELAAGQEQRGVDFVLHTISLSFIRGHIVKPVGSDNCSVRIKALADDLPSFPSDGMAGSVGFVISGSYVKMAGSGVVLANLAGPDPAGRRQVDQDGKFEFHNVPVGSHTLRGTCTVGDQQFTTKLPIELNAAGLDNVELRPVGPSTITGQVHIEGESKSKVSETRVWAEGESSFVANGSDSDKGELPEDGTFAFADLAPETYHLHVTVPDGLYVKSITEDGRDVQESGIDLTAGGMSVPVQVVLSANGGSIEGSVENGAGAKVTLIPSDPQAPRSLAKMVVAGADGHFAFPVVAPGRYKLYAWEDVDENAALYDAAFRKPFDNQAQTVDVDEKQKATAQLHLIPKVE